jgi:hypothetical protein
MRVASSEDPAKIDMLRWIGWLCADRHGLNAPSAPAAPPPQVAEPRGPTLLDVRIRTELLRVREKEMQLDRQAGLRLDAASVRAVAGRHARRVTALLDRLAQDLAADLLSAGLIDSAAAARASAVVGSRVESVRRAVAEDPLGETA